MSSPGSRLRSCVNSSAKIMAVSGERIVPPIIAAMPMSAHSPLSPTGMNFAEAAPSAPPIISNGASTPPDVPDPSAKDQTSDFPIRIPRRAGPTTSPRNSSWIVSNPEHARLDDSADTDKQTTDRRPPHPVKRQLCEKIFEGVHQRGQKTRTEPCQYPNQKRKDQTFINIGC